MVTGRHHAPTIVRIWADGYSGESQNYDIDDWDRGQFTLPAEHPAAAILKTCHKQTVLVTVSSTPELEWEVDSVGWDKYSMDVICKPRNVRAHLFPDRYLIEKGRVS